MVMGVSHRTVWPSATSIVTRARWATWKEPVILGKRRSRSKKSFSRWVDLNLGCDRSCGVSNRGLSVHSGLAIHLTARSRKRGGDGRQLHDELMSMEEMIAIDFQVHDLNGSPAHVAFNEGTVRSAFPPQVKIKATATRGVLSRHGGLGDLVGMHRGILDDCKCCAADVWCGREAGGGGRGRVSGGGLRRWQCGSRVATAVKTFA
ncbi:hypothetical protein DFJ77DRAFT_263075 [Powellomyces hirtus]|nr:hypothetical protein DFJ77DRAFT_263075 [Powellomyces hirtus]